MTADCFLDTNVLFYAAMGRTTDPEKHARARLIMAETHFGVSGQVLQEFVATTTRKTARPCVSIDRELVMAAVRVAERYKISYWDAAIIAAAQHLRTEVLYSEDLNDGQLYGAVRVVNPFRLN